MRISFVILHYLAGDVTASCIDALLAICGGIDTDIVVVDNASRNGSGQNLEKNYKSHKNIHFILMPQNEGFARGNNAGYIFAKEHLAPDFIVVMNNDVIIKDSSFVDKIRQEYISDPFAVLGPDIFCPITGQHQNPAHLYGFSKQEILDIKRKLSTQLKHFLYKRFCWNVKLLLGIAHNIPREEINHTYHNNHTDCVLHGACYIFSQDFISRRSLAFNPGTFLYFEEDILHYECMRDHLKMRYSPRLEVLHFEDAATNKAIKLSFMREKKKKERILQSLDIMLSLFDNDSNK